MTGLTRVPTSSSAGPLIGSEDGRYRPSAGQELTGMDGVRAFRADTVACARSIWHCATRRPGTMVAIIHRDSFCIP